MFKNIKPYVLAMSVVCALSVMTSVNLSQAAEKKTVYVSSNGSADNSGLKESEPTTFAKAYAQIGDIDTIMVMDDMTYEEPPAHSGMLTIKGNTAGVDITLPTHMNLRGDLTVSNVNLTRGDKDYHIYANGHSLVVAEDVTSSQKFIAFGGTNGKAYTGDTDIKLLGGTYDWVCGGSSNAVVNGNSNIEVGGNANIGGSTENGCIIYGGGNNFTVTGEINVTLSGNAVCQYLFGGSRMKGTDEQSPEKINVNIAGGKAMNIYGGTQSDEMNGCDVNVKMTGGSVEGIFGGSNGASLVGNVNIDLLGGKITRRVYTGCYNDTNSSFSSNFKTDYRVEGTTTLRIYPTISTSDIASGSDLDKGVFAGSRYSSAFNDEANTIIFLDGCYNTYKDKIKHNSLGGFEDYVVSATAGGDVQGTNEGGKIYIVSEAGKFATMNGVGEYETATVSLTNSGATVNTVNFADYNFKTHDMKTTANVSGITVNAQITANNNGETLYSEPMAIVAVFDGSGRLVATDLIKNISGPLGDYTFELPFGLEREKEYTVKLMLWSDDENIYPLSESNVKTVKVGEKTALKQLMERYKGDYSAVITADKID